MKRFRMVCSLLAILASPRPAGAGEGIEWLGDLEAARAEAKRSGRPMLVVFR